MDRTPNDDRADAGNPNNDAHWSNLDNHANQLNPEHETLVPSQSGRGLAPFVSWINPLKIPVSAVRFRPWPPSEQTNRPAFEWACSFLTMTVGRQTSRPALPRPGRRSPETGDWHECCCGLGEPLRFPLSRSCHGRSHRSHEGHEFAGRVGDQLPDAACQVSHGADRVDGRKHPAAGTRRLRARHARHPARGSRFVRIRRKRHDRRRASARSGLGRQLRSSLFKGICRCASHVGIPSHQDQGGESGLMHERARARRTCENGNVGPHASDAP